MIRLMVVLEGGLVQWVGCDTVLPMEVLIVDYDTDGADDDEITAIPQDNGDTEDAVARIEVVDGTDPDFVRNAFAAMQEDDDE